MSALHVIKPLQVTPEMLVDTNVPEADYPEYNPATIYALGARVIAPETHDIWESVISDNAGNAPAAAANKWLRVGAVNRWKPFDKVINSQAQQAGSITYRLKPGRAVTEVDAINLTGAISMRVQVVDPTFGVIADRTVSLQRSPIKTGWWAFWFGERRAPTQAFFHDLPGLPNAEIIIEIVGGDDLGVGVILIGYRRSFSLGVKMGARVGIQDFSTKEREKYGDLTLVEGSYADRAGFSMLLKAGEVDAFKAFLKEVRATPCLWIGSSRYESTTIYGTYKNFEILINYFEYSDAELELESLI